MQVIENVTNPEGKAASLLQAVQSAMGATPNIFAAMANAPAALKGLLDLNGALAGGSLSGQLRESIALAVAGVNGCDYCASAHTFIGSKSGLGADELAANLRGKSSDVATQAALAFTVKLVESRGHPSADDLEELREAGFSDEDAVEIVAHVGLNTFTNYFNETFSIEVDFPKVKSKEA